MPPYLRRSQNVSELLPLLYLRGLSTGDFCEALPTLLGKRRELDQTIGALEHSGD